MVLHMDNNIENYCPTCRRWLSVTDGDVFLGEPEDHDRCTYCYGEVRGERPAKLDSGADDMRTI